MRKMLFVEKFGIPFHDDDDSDSRHFKNKGFDVTFVGIQDWEEFQSLESKFSFRDFDVVFLMIEGLETLKTTKFPEDIIHEIKIKLDLINKNRATPILLAGMHLSLVKEYQISQMELFNGLFIGSETDSKDYSFILMKLLATYSG